MKGIIRGRSQVAGTITVTTQNRTTDKSPCKVPVEHPEETTPEDTGLAIKHVGKKDADDTSE